MSHILLIDLQCSICHRKEEEGSPETTVTLYHGKFVNCRCAVYLCDRCANEVHLCPNRSFHGERVDHHVRDLSNPIHVDPDGCAPLKYTVRTLLVLCGLANMAFFVYRFKTENPYVSEYVDVMTGSISLIIALYFGMIRTFCCSQMRVGYCSKVTSFDVVIVLIGLVLASITIAHTDFSDIMSEVVFGNNVLFAITMVSNLAFIAA